MELAVAAAALFAVVVFALTSSRKEHVLPFLIGVTAGLVDARLGRLHVFSALVGVWALVHFLQGRRYSLNPFLLLISVSGLAASSVLYGELVNSNTLAIQLVILAASGGIIAGFATESHARSMLAGLLCVCTAASAVGVLQIAGVIQMTLWHTDVSGLGRPMAFYPEPDWLGLFAAIGLILAWRVLDESWRRNVLVTLNGAVFVFSFARAAWVALVVSVALMFVISIVRRRSDSVPPRRAVAGLLALLLVAGTAGLAASPQLRSDLGRRLAQTVQAQDGDVSGQARIAQTQGLLYLAETAPWYGQGVSASGRVGVSGRLTLGGVADNNVGSNWILAMWVDSKFLALPLIALLGIAALVGARSVPGQLLVVALVNSLFSNATYTPIVWLLLGLVLATALKTMSLRRVANTGLGSRRAVIYRLKESDSDSPAPCRPHVVPAG
ncbi:O-antigen ligase family protein [Aeromicrobium endophyticum]|uniref:O-antigen ligase-related domain-containing protein n=1 Tax=Aeromicrobium endophyticum TaxID=2292704 RepID=A0A371PAL7_9ACTN|nr:O-antigen ligase family protein [Aeromicrobium endophyticum]REK73004.1 hypothetical protein DX116_05280 [Aeromicrobium endophyticum]